MAFDVKAAEELGFHLVDEAAARFERVHAAGTQVFVGADASIEHALTQIEEWANRFPGIYGDTPSRSDGAIESKDVQEAQSAAAGENGPTPAADAEAAAALEAQKRAEEATAAGATAPEATNTGPGPNEVSPAAPETDTTGLTSDTPGEVATGRVDVPAEPEPTPAPEGTVAS